jgi:tRNA pseudouridine38-40 synthase
MSPVEKFNYSNKTNYRYFVRLSYNGKNYHGWQSQKNANTVQELLNQTFSIIFKHNINIIGAGRTDQGVHAKNFFAHFDLPFMIENITNTIYKLNSFLPYDIVVHDIFPVKNNVHARFDALNRTYKYQISQIKNPFLKEYVYFIYGEKLNIVNMNIATKILFHYDDFSCFSKSHTQTNNNLCKIYNAEWTIDNDLIIFTITANRFLRNMVRAIVGTMIDIGKDRYHPEKLHDIISSKDRKKAGASVPPYALFLTNIEYPENIKLY